MDLEQLQELADKDLNINDTELDLESLKTPQLHNKYLKHLTKFKLLLTRAQDDFTRIKRDKWEYYTGKAPAEVYAEKPFDLKILKADIGIYLEADGELQQLSQRMAYTKQIVDYLERILREINNRNWNIRNTIEWKKFLHGE